MPWVLTCSDCLSGALLRTIPHSMVGCCYRPRHAGHDDRAETEADFLPAWVDFATWGSHDSPWRMLLHVAEQLGRERGFISFQIGSGSAERGSPCHSQNLSNNAEGRPDALQSVRAQLRFAKIQGVRQAAAREKIADQLREVLPKSNRYRKLLQAVLGRELRTTHAAPWSHIKLVFQFFNDSIFFRRSWSPACMSQGRRSSRARKDCYPASGHGLHGATETKRVQSFASHCALFGRLADEPILTTEELQSLEAAETLCGFWTGPFRGMSSRTKCRLRL